jgi:rRNA maturation endonuclease Nob1
VNGIILSCPGCERRWPVAANLGHFEREALEAAACPDCGSQALRCVPIVRADRRRDPATGRRGRTAGN